MPGCEYLIAEPLFKYSRTAKYATHESTKNRAILKQVVREAGTICPRPGKLTISSYLFARWHRFRHVGYLRHQQQVDLLTLKVVSVACDVGYLCANFSLPRPLCSRLRPDVRDRRQTSDRSQTASSLNAPLDGGVISDNVDTYRLPCKVVVCNRLQRVVFSYFTCIRVQCPKSSLIHK